MTISHGEPTHCLLILTEAGMSGNVGERAARAAGLEPRLVATKADCADRVAELRREARELGLRTLAIYTSDWCRQPTPQFFELVAARLRLPDRRIVVGDGSEQIRLGRWRLAQRLAALPFELAMGLALVALEGARFARRRRQRPPNARRLAPKGELRSVVAIWTGAPDLVAGGSVTHISGILSSLRRAGLKVGLLTTCEPPPQLGSVVDDIEVLPPLPRSARVLREVELVAANRAGLAAGRRLVDRLGPAFIYQRHGAFLTYGIELAAEADIPLVLEWNNSEAWSRTHWHMRRRITHLFDGLMVSMERRAVQEASLIAPVSEQAAEMAREAGAVSGRMVVVPNGVDLQVIDRSRASVEAEAPVDVARVGWVGSFGPWHGAEILIQALPMLPAEVQVVMIGDGAGRRPCEAQAEQLGVAERITWTGLLPHHEAVRRLAECSLLASPHVSTDGRPFFGSPTKLFEYMAIGRPIVASALEQIGDVLDDGRTACLVPSGDPEALARGIRHVLALPDRGRALGMAARAEAESKHTWDQRARVILESLVEPNRRSTG